MHLLSPIIFSVTTDKFQSGAAFLSNRLFGNFFLFFITFCSHFNFPFWNQILIFPRWISITILFTACMSSNCMKTIFSCCFSCQGDDWWFLVPLCMLLEWLVACWQKLVAFCFSGGYHFSYVFPFLFLPRHPLHFLKNSSANWQFFTIWLHCHCLGYKYNLSVTLSVSQLLL